MNASLNNSRRRWDGQAERILGYLALFMIGAISWGSERFSQMQTPVANESPQA